MPFQIGPVELIVVLVIALLVLGPKKLPEVGRSVGKGIREFTGSLNAGQSSPTPASERDEAPASEPSADR